MKSKQFVWKEEQWNAFVEIKRRLQEHFYYICHIKKPIPFIFRH